MTRRRVILLARITRRWEKLDVGQPSTAQGERETVEGLPRRGRGDVCAEPPREMNRTRMTASQQWKRRARSRCTNTAARN
jgi:hypothetical protein